MCFIFLFLCLVIALQSKSARLLQLVQIYKAPFQRQTRNAVRLSLLETCALPEISNPSLDDGEECVFCHH